MRACWVAGARVAMRVALSGVLGCGTAATVPDTGALLAPEVVDEPVLPSAAKGVAFLSSGGEMLDWFEVVERASAVRVVYFGELHTSERHHALQAALIEALAERGPVIVGIEMLPWNAWAATRSLSNRSVTLQQFAEHCEWGARWGFDLELYRSVLEMALHDRVRLVPLNAPDGFSRRVSRRGFGALDPAQRRRIPPELLGGNDAYIEWLATIMQGHGMELTPEMIGRFVQAQLLWDTTMAASLAGIVEGVPETTRVVVIAGGGHIRHRWGIPERLDQFVETTSLTVLCDDDGEENADEAVADITCRTGT
jgi:uncharacterized iron-regulated protein